MSTITVTPTPYRSETAPFCDCCAQDLEDQDHFEASVTVAHRPARLCENCAALVLEYGAAELVKRANTALSLLRVSICEVAEFIERIDPDADFTLTPTPDDPAENE